MHGLGHMYQSGDLCRKAFWFVLTIAGTCACFFHVIMTVQNYLETPVTSILIDDAAMAEFPDVTLCNLKPMSESLGEYYKDVVHQHFEDNWGFFEQWWPNERKRQVNESRVDYQRRLRKIFERYLQIFWVSDDSRDLGMMDKVMLLHCSFNGIPCGHKNFSLVQNYRYWNCYTFSPSPQFRFASSGHTEDTGLNLILYTDSNFHESIYDQFAAYSRQKFDEEEMTHPYSLKEYITTASIYNDVQNGKSALVHVDQMQYVTLNQPGERQCTNDPQEIIEYTTSFGHNPSTERKRRYTKTDREFAVEAKQQFVFDNCGCYSHHFPFHVNLTQLCYFVPLALRRHPSKKLLDRVACHDEHLRIAEENSYNFIQDYLKYKPCEYRKFTTFKTISTWPRSDEHIDFVNEFLIPKMQSGKEFIGKGDAHVHHIFNFTNENSAALLNKPILSHEELALSRLLNQDCHPNKSAEDSIRDMWCLDKEKMAYNVLQVIIRLTSPAAAKYEEKFSYEWPEALSEIGGIFGLWVGMSLLTFFEFIELFYVMVVSRDSRPQQQPSGDRESLPNSSSMQHQMELLLSRLMEEETIRRAPGPVQMTAGRR
uniref:Amiloride-sensitive sodium channel n=1 Tax=Macrostomum lignano TaxID=282301 RepID=A0A1I8JMM0_9PLAT